MWIFVFIFLLFNFVVVVATAAAFVGGVVIVIILLLVNFALNDNEELCIKNGEFRIENDEFYRALPGSRSSSVGS